MDNFKPYSYLYKRTTEPAKLKSCFVVQLPAGKKLSMRAGYPDTSGSKSTIKYTIENDPSQSDERTEYFVNEFNWDGNPHEVLIIVGDGQGGGGGQSVTGSNDAEFD